MLNLFPLISSIITSYFSLNSLEHITSRVSSHKSNIFSKNNNERWKSDHDYVEISRRHNYYKGE